MRRAIVLLGIAASISVVPAISASHTNATRSVSRPAYASVNVEQPASHGGDGGFEWG